MVYKYPASERTSIQVPGNITTVLDPVPKLILTDSRH
eukprot:COSAG05_NODE_14316_length_400_cov_1.365449_1_plen_36_part_01